MREGNEIRKAMQYRKTKVRKKGGRDTTTETIAGEGNQEIRRHKDGREEEKGRKGKG